ncbi:sodium:calcium antiporter [Rhodoplanes sp. TEM]|uniref:Sodium:calcium antiporter n=1 Tax=Rhodoplanes tepidamans TaxID=200616 RepID=A0ABT5J6S2_RHOTP|nr:MULTISPECIES: sodium:calcium antiporter [Rhodoplanes]MDC7785288.1 sodium:calcium antiporter [Rhodoplanes tepidamans]MDC7984645.1 sodium:calcium antiporter [Rhodoplanes sp. TEM]MDQ0353546.1 cation:H+ antiporter [Rhodoplanes tepidamans]
MPGIADLSLAATIGVFVASAAAIAFAGARLSGVADKLADRTGMGEVMAGALFVGAATSLPGAITSVTTAAQGAPQLAIGNALGGLTAQTAFVAVADLFYRRANLEHAAASASGLAQGILLVALLSMPLIAAAQPPVTIWGIHPVSILIPVAYGFGLRLLSQIRAEPMWEPVQTDETREALSAPDTGDGAASDRSLWLRFLLHAGITAAAGWAIGEASLGIVDKTPLSESAVGTVFSAVANSLPELVTAIAAVRIGAVSLAVGDVIGGNAFEVMFLSAADMVHDGSIYQAMTAEHRTTGLIAMLMTAVLLLGMVRREKSGFGNIGFESTLVLVLYAGSVVLIFL